MRRMIFSGKPSHSIILHSTALPTESKAFAKSIKKTCGDWLLVFKAVFPTLFLREYMVSITTHRSESSLVEASLIFVFHTALSLFSIRNEKIFPEMSRRPFLDNCHNMSCKLSQELKAEGELRSNHLVLFLSFIAEDIFDKKGEK